MGSNKTFHYIRYTFPSTVKALIRRHLFRERWIPIFEVRVSRPYIPVETKPFANSEEIQVCDECNLKRINFALICRVLLKLQTIVIWKECCSELKDGVSISFKCLERLLGGLNPWIGRGPHCKFRVYNRAQLRTDLISVKSSLKEKHHEGYLLCPLPLLSRQVVPVDVEGREYGLARPRSQVILLLHLLLL